jgi:hypothetical protein
MKKHIEKPVKAVVNGEGAFVAQSVRQAGDFDTAEEYWRWHCAFPHNSDKYGQEVRELELKLREIDKEYCLPNWGTFGT